MIFSEEENLKITGFKTIAEFQAYEKGRADEETVLVKWIEAWDGKTNSALGKILQEKFKELYK